MLRNIGFIGLHKKKTLLTGEIEKKINENNNINLEEILGDDTIIDEVQNQNKTLLNYLDKEKIKKMIDYIIKEPPEDISHDKGHKFPWVCSQIFNLGDYNIMKYFLKTNKELEEENKKIGEEREKDNKSENQQNMAKFNLSEMKTRKSKKIKINEIIHQKEKDNKIELLDYLLSFLSSNKESNYVLCGYFASIIKTLLNMEPTLIIKYLYSENKEFIRALIYHSYRQSIAEILNKIIQYNSEEEKFNVEDMALTRMDILEGLFEQIDINMDNEKLDSISTLIKNISKDEKLLNDMLNNKKLIECIITKPLKNINLIDKGFGEEFIINKRRNFNILIDIIISWINSANSFDIELPSTDDDDDESEQNQNINTFCHTLLSYELISILSNIIKVNFNKNNDAIEENKILQCLDEKVLVPLGIFRIKIVELLGNLFTYFKHIPDLYDKLLIESQFFENAFEYLFEYELNNIYQENFLILLKKFLNYSNDHPLLAEFLFKKFNLIDLIISKLKDIEISENSEENSKKDRILYESGNSTSRGYIAFLISLSYKINTVLGGEPLRINNTLSREGSISFTTRAVPFVGKEEINEFYGMDENELYEVLSNESQEKNSKLNCPVKSMEKYLNDKWTEFFNEHIADKIRLYETKLYKEDKNENIFYNPFIEDDENDNDKKVKKTKSGPVIEKFLYEEDNNDIDTDINLNNRFKMSMRLPKRSNNAIRQNQSSIGGKRGSGGTKPSKVLVDEIDEDIEKFNKNKSKEENDENLIDKFKKDKGKKEEENINDDNPLDRFKLQNKNKNNTQEEEENPLDKFKNNKNEELYEEENPLDKFKNNKNEELYEEEEENPLDKFKNNKNKNEELYEEEEENPLDKFKKEKNDRNDNNTNKDKEEEENPLDKFKKGNKK